MAKTPRHPGITTMVGDIFFPWNRTELLFAFSAETFDKTREMLAAAHIKYCYRFPFQDGYYLYVHKRDLEEAERILNSK